MNRTRCCSTRGWLLRFLAVLTGLAPFVAAEIGLRIAGIGVPPRAADPFVEFAALRPLFVRNATGDRWEIPAARQPYFKPDSFAVSKGPQTFRIFCLGGSTVQGNPYSIETAFTTWLELSLRAANPDRDWEVVNCGGISYASYRLEPILRECLSHQPDLFVLYVGDNEFLEDRSFAHLKRVPSGLARLTDLLRPVHLFQVIRRAWSHQAVTDAEPRGPTPLAAEVEARLDYQGGLARYQRDDRWQQQVVDQFQQTLKSMIDQAQSAGVPVLLVDPVSNIRDCPPFKVEVDAGIPTANRERLATLLSQSRDPQASPAQRLDWLDEAAAIDSRNAAVQFQRGQALVALGRDDEARQAFLRAKDEDICPLRLTEPLRGVIYRVGQESKTPIVPVLARFSQLSPHGIPGDELMLDHVHPTISGQQLIAEMLLDAMTERQWVHRTAGWETRRQQAFEQHLATLDAPYYARGQEHLEGLRRWAQGRVTKQREAP